MNFGISTNNQVLLQQNMLQEIQNEFIKVNPISLKEYFEGMLGGGESLEIEDSMVNELTIKTGCEESVARNYIYSIQKVYEFRKTFSNRR